MKNLQHCLYICLLCLFFITGNAESATVNWAPEFIIGGELFPSGILAHPIGIRDGNVYTDGDAPADIGLPPLSIKVVSPSDQAHIKVEINIEGLAEPSEFIGVLDKKGMTYNIYPVMNWKYSSLPNIKQPTVTTAQFALYIDGNLVDKKSMVVSVRSINDAPFYADGDYGWIFAAYVNENHPWIDPLLREAINSGTVPYGFTGYQQGQQYALQQIFAIWNVFQRRGFQYSSIATPTAYSNKYYSQYIRTFEDTINTSQANCADGSILFAGMLRKIGLDPFLVMIPGHMYLGVWLDPQHKTPIFLETTMMGNTNIYRYAEANSLSGVLSGLLGVANRNQASAISFNNAIREGSNKFTQDKQHFVNHDRLYQLIDINQQREAGVRPINR